MSKICWTGNNYSDILNLCLDSLKIQYADLKNYVQIPPLDNELYVRTESGMTLCYVGQLLELDISRKFFILKKV